MGIQTVFCGTLGFRGRLSGFRKPIFFIVKLVNVILINRNCIFNSQSLSVIGDFSIVNRL